MSTVVRKMRQSLAASTEVKIWADGTLVANTSDVNILVLAKWAITVYTYVSWAP
jgi:hypothetical protein